MPLPKGFRHTEETKRKIRKRIIKLMDKKHLKEIGFKKGYMPWNKGTKGLSKGGGCKGFRHSKKTKLKLSKMRIGENNPHYKNGIGSYRQRAWKMLPHKCRKCGIENDKILIIHHKDRDRKNNKMENLEILCLNCHFLAHGFNTTLNLGKYAIKGLKRRCW